MKDTPTLTAWHQEQLVHDEAEFTPDAGKGWHAWNGQSPELQVVYFVKDLITMIHPGLIVETGVGQGYTTRAIAETLEDDQELVAFESDDNWRESLWTLPFWRHNRFNVRLAEEPMPPQVLIAEADLCVFDSDFEFRFQEVSWWDHYAKPGAVCFVHDTSDRPDTIHNSLREFILDMGMTGVFLKNPRGSFLAVQGRRDDGREENSSEETSGEEDPTGTRV